MKKYICILYIILNMKCYENKKDLLFEVTQKKSDLIVNYFSRKENIYLCPEIVKIIKKYFEKEKIYIDKFSSKNIFCVMNSKHEDLCFELKNSPNLSFSYNFDKLKFLKLKDNEIISYGTNNYYLLYKLILSKLSRSNFLIKNNINNCDFSEITDELFYIDYKIFLSDNKRKQLKNKKLNIQPIFKYNANVLNSFFVMLNNDKNIFLNKLYSLCQKHVLQYSLYIKNIKTINIFFNGVYFLLNTPFKTQVKKLLNTVPEDYISKINFKDKKINQISFLDIHSIKNKLFLNKNKNYKKKIALDTIEIINFIQELNKYINFFICQNITNYVLQNYANGFRTFYSEFWDINSQNHWKILRFQILFLIYLKAYYLHKIYYDKIKNFKMKTFEHIQIIRIIKKNLNHVKNIVTIFPTQKKIIEVGGRKKSFNYLKDAEYCRKLHSILCFSGKTNYNVFYRVSKYINTNKNNIYKIEDSNKKNLADKINEYYMIITKSKFPQNIKLNSIIDIKKINEWHEMKKIKELIHDVKDFTKYKNDNLIERFFSKDLFQEFIYNCKKFKMSKDVLNINSINLMITNINSVLLQKGRVN